MDVLVARVDGEARERVSPRPCRILFCDVRMVLADVDGKIAGHFAKDLEASSADALLSIELGMRWEAIHQRDSGPGGVLPLLQQRFFIGSFVVCAVADSFTEVANLLHSCHFELCGLGIEAHTSRMLDDS